MTQSQSMAIDVFWSFRSPWSYLATRRLRDWQTQYDLIVNFRPVYPIAVRSPEFFHSVQPQWFSYFMTDVFRVAEFLALPFVWPRPDPVVQIVDEHGRRQTGEVQPYIDRLTRLGALAEELGAGLAFADEVSALIWGGTTGWDQGEHLAQAAHRAGLDLAGMDQRIIHEADRLDAVIAANQVAHEQAGHWGVPTCVYQGAPFFGQDRLDVLLWTLQKEGLRSR
ncbi:MAG: DsbA family protein [Proteobacteria bacterium]|mgnify:FL=1|nr:DsbA family protein [Pseudomonadota bacterium]